MHIWKLTYRHVTYLIPVDLRKIVIARQDKLILTSTSQNLGSKQVNGEMSCLESSRVFSKKNPLIEYT